MARRTRQSEVPLMSQACHEILRREEAQPKGRRLLGFPWLEPATGQANFWLAEYQQEESHDLR